MASVKGFGPGKYENCKVYENIAQCAGGSASTTGALDGVPMVTGGKGVHVIVPLRRTADWDSVKGFAKRLATALADRAPEGAEHIKETLAGSILWVTWPTVIKVLVIYVMIGAFLRLLHDRFNCLTGFIKGAHG